VSAAGASISLRDEGRKATTYFCSDLWLLERWVKLHDFIFKIERPWLTNLNEMEVISGEPSYSTNHRAGTYHPPTPIF
jgi:hypothetical protein